MIKLPESAKAVNPNAVTDGVQLPFVHDFFYWINGDKRLAELKNASHYGGWFSNDDLHEAAVDEFGAGPSVELLTRSGDDGEYAVYGTRNLTIVPIRTRKRWTDRSHTQTLCLIGLKTEDGWKPWGAAVLTAKGYSTDRFTKSLKMWDNMTKDARKEVGGAPSWFFWASIGTHGKYHEEMVGKVKQSPITPIEAFIPPKEKITAKLMEKLYIGDEAAEYVSVLYNDSEEWAKDPKWLKNEEKILEKEPQYSELPPLDEDDLPY